MEEPPLVVVSARWVLSGEATTDGDGRGVLGAFSATPPSLGGVWDALPLRVVTPRTHVLVGVGSPRMKR